MTNINCWEEIKNLSGRTLKTLDRRKPFQVVEVTEHIVTVMPLGTEKERPIQRAGIESFPTPDGNRHANPGRTR